MFARALVLLLSCAYLLVPRSAAAHTVGISSGEYRASGTDLAVTLAFARADVARVAGGLERNGDGHLTALELELGRTDLERTVLDRIIVTRGGARCAHTLREVELTDQDGLTLRGRFACDAEGPFEVRFALSEDLPAAHRHVARAIGRETHDEVLMRGHDTFVVVPDAAPPPRASSASRGFFGMGVQHILTGYDHVLFVLGLVLLRGPLARLLAVVTSFTVAHSISLALATLGVLAPSGSVVEPAIALSIAYVGLENLLLLRAPPEVAQRRLGRRWMLTFAFGLIHGFGFAGALREIALPRARIPAALLAFNAGVEAGQVALLMVALPLLGLLAARPWFARRGAAVASSLIAAAGVVWFVARLAGD